VIALKYSKKAQVGMIETIMVLVIFFIILVIGIFYYSTFRAHEIEKIGKTLSSQQQEILLASITSMPEFACEDKNCIDATKLIATKTIIEKNPEYYGSLFKFKTIKVEILYPEPLEKDKECNKVAHNQQNYPDNCDHFIIYSKSLPNAKTTQTISTPISLYFPSKKEYKIAKLSITKET